MKGLLEAETKKKLKACLNKHGVYYEMNVPGGYGKQTVDFVCCWRGRYVAIETKRQLVEKPTARQRNVMTEMRRAGAMTWLVTLDADENLKWIEQVDGCN